MPYPDSLLLSNYIKKCCFLPFCSYLRHSYSLCRSILCSLYSHLKSCNTIFLFLFQNFRFKSVQQKTLHIQNFTSFQSVHVDRLTNKALKKLRGLLSATHTHTIFDVLNCFCTLNLLVIFS